MSLIKSNTAGLGGSGSPGGSLGSFYGFTIDNSVRMSDAANTTLQWSAGTPSSSTTWTMSVWLKKYNPDATQAANEFFSAGSSGSAYTLFSFQQSNQQFTHQTELPGARNKNFYNKRYRDSSTWFHLVLRANLGESTQADRLRLYINGEQQTHTADGITQSTWSYINQSGITQNWGGKSGIASGNPGCDYYFADINFTDGQSYAPTEFGETKDGVWIPKDPSVTYGNNGYRLEFKQTGTGADANGIGADTSGNGNHFTSANLAAHDIMPDTPTNNFATMNPLYHSSRQATLTEGNLKVQNTQNFSNTGANSYGAVSTFAIPKDKKVYIEVQCDSHNGTYWFAGFATQSGLEAGVSSTNTGGASSVTFYNRAVMKNGTQFQYSSSSGVGGLGGGTSPFAIDDVLGMAIDGSNGNVWFSKNGTYFKTIASNNGSTGNTGDPSAGTDPVATVDNVPAEDLFVVIGTGNPATVFVNFGQDSTNVASANADSQGIGTFEYAVPTGFVSLCAANLTTPAIGPTESSQADDHFDTVLYEATGSTLNITGVNFQPDWIWAKRRDGIQEGRMTDSVRGVNAQLRPAATNVETTFTNAVTSFNSDGFTLGADTGPGSQSFNYYTDSHVAWLWKAGGSASSNSNGTITSSVSANQDAGFSIVSYTGTGSNGTIGHGLSSAPESIWIKARTRAEAWLVYHKFDGGTDGRSFLNLDVPNAKFDNGPGSYFQDTPPTASVFYQNTSSYNQNTDTYIAYCFHSVEGYSKLGNFEGTSSSDGAFVFTGFRPTWVLIKSTSSGTQWMIYDSKREGYNVDNDALKADDASKEATDDDIDLLSNGFKLRRNSTNFNNSSHTYIYLAFAEAPFKFANAR